MEECSYTQESMVSYSRPDHIFQTTRLILDRAPLCGVSFPPTKTCIEAVKLKRRPILVVRAPCLANIF